MTAFWPLRRRSLLLLALLAGLSFPTARANDDPSPANPELPREIQLLSGQLYRNVSIIGMDQRGIYFRHPHGIARVVYEEMTDASWEAITPFIELEEDSPGKESTPQGHPSARPLILIQPVQVQTTQSHTPFRLPSYNRLRHFHPRLQPFSAVDIEKVNRFYYRRGWSFPYGVAPSPYLLPQYFGRCFY